MRKIEKLYSKKIPSDKVITGEFARFLCEVSREVNRQIGVLIDRNGKVLFVIVGGPHHIDLPDFKRFRTSKRRFRGLRCIHTHLFGENLNDEDLTDLILLRLDMMCAITVDERGLPQKIYSAYIKPPERNENLYWDFLPPVHPSNLDLNFKEFIKNLESEFSRKVDGKFSEKNVERGVLIGITTKSLDVEEESLKELENLAKTAGIEVVEKVIQKRKKLDSKYLMGKGKLRELIIRSMYKGITVLIFNQELAPNQVRSICSETDLKVIDRNQLILDIFAKHALTEEGRLKVELAQLKYMLPRLSEKDDALSRLTGGIGGRGPGETKLEMDRRRIKKRISLLEGKLKKIEKNRKLRRKERNGNEVFKISVVGYTNSGKSTLVKYLTGCDLLIEDKLFATLNPFTRKLKGVFPVDVVISDTVGFIKKLPKELVETFKSTIEEISESDFLIHLVDISSPNFEDEMRSVNNILSEILSRDIPRILVFNKVDLVDGVEFENRIKRFGGIGISAIKGDNVQELIEIIKKEVDKYAGIKACRS